LAGSPSIAGPGSPQVAADQEHHLHMALTSGVVADVTRGS